MSVSINFGGVSVRSDSDVQAIARTVTDELTRQIQLSKMGIA